MAESLRLSARELAAGVTLAAGSPVEVVLLSGRRVRITGMLFDTSKCFLLPPAAKGMKAVPENASLLESPHVLVVGHTDRAGSEAYNDPLSLERAKAVAAYLTEDLAAWEAFYGSSKPAEKRWGRLEDQHMLRSVPGDAEPFFQGPANGTDSAEFQAAVKKFQESAGLKVDGICGPNTRKALIAEYMALDGTTLDAAIPLETHGCGESFPAFSQIDSVPSPEDRRVEVFLFSGPVEPPAVPEISGKAEGLYPQWLAQVTDTDDVRIPDEPITRWEIRLHGEDTRPMAGAFFTVDFGTGLQGPFQADAQGKGRLDLPEFCPESVDLAWGPSASDLRFTQTMFIDCDAGSKAFNLKAKLNNLGYGGFLDLHDSLRAFQVDYQVDHLPEPLGMVDGKAPPASEARLKAIFTVLDCNADPEVAA